MASRAPNINRSRVHEEMVQRLSTQKLPNSERTLFPTIRELLCFAALLCTAIFRRSIRPRRRARVALSRPQRVHNADEHARSRRRAAGGRSDVRL
jgi:hypothetical protein